MSTVSNRGRPLINLALAAGALASCGSDTGARAPSNAGTAPTSLTADREQVEIAQRALAAEPGIHGVDHSPPRWTVSVIDDGTRRDGYAEYVCLVLIEHRAGGEVAIVDHGDPGRQLGFARCPATRAAEGSDR